MNDGCEGLPFFLFFWLVSRNERACTTLRSGRVCARSAVSKGFRDPGRVGAWTCGAVALRGALWRLISTVWAIPLSTHGGGRSRVVPTVVGDLAWYPRWWAIPRSTHSGGRSRVVCGDAVAAVVQRGNLASLVPTLSPPCRRHAQWLVWVQPGQIQWLVIVSTDRTGEKSKIGNFDTSRRNWNAKKRTERKRNESNAQKFSAVSTQVAAS